MAEIDEAAFRRKLTSEEPGGLYVITGEEKYLVGRAARRLIRKAAGDSFPEFNDQRFDNEADPERIGVAAAALPFFAERKCVSVADYNVEEKDAATLKKLYDLLDDLPESTVLIFWFPTLEIDEKKSAKWRKFLKTAAESGTLLRCPRRSAAELRKTLIREAEKAGCALSRQNADRILDYAGQDLTALQREMEKLCAYTLGRGETEIEAGAIEALVAKSTETTVFLMANALTAGNYENAYRLLDQLFYQNEEPVAVLGALSAAYVDMARVRAALESGGTAAGASAYGDYRNREFRLRNAERSARRLSGEVLRRSLDLLLETDLALKGSRLEGRLLLEELVAKLLLAAKGE